MFDRLPNEIIYNIMSYTDIFTLSNILQVSKKSNNIVDENRYYIIDKILREHRIKERIKERERYKSWGGPKIQQCLIRNNEFIKIYPRNIETYNKYKYIIDLTSIIKDYPNKISNDFKMYIIDNELVHLDLVFNRKLENNIFEKYYKKYVYENGYINYNKLMKIVQKQDISIYILEELITDASLNTSIVDISTIWNDIWKYQIINKNFIDKYIEKVNWFLLSENKKSIMNDINIIHTYYDKIFWPAISKWSISEKIIEKYISYIDNISWMTIAEYSNLSINFIKNNINNLGISRILHCQDIPEYYINELINMGKIKEEYWSEISEHQKLSFNFIEKYKDKLILHLLARNPKIERHIIYKIYN